MWLWLGGPWINDLKEAKSGGAIWTGRNEDVTCPSHVQKTNAVVIRCSCGTAVPYRKHPIMHLKYPIKRVKERNAETDSRAGWGTNKSHAHAQFSTRNLCSKNSLTITLKSFSPDMCEIMQSACYTVISLSYIQFCFVLFFFLKKGEQKAMMSTGRKSAGGKEEEGNGLSSKAPLTGF